jgi:hypothetical protein
MLSLTRAWSRLFQQSAKIEKVEDTIIAELTNVIMDFADGLPSVIFDIQPPSSVVKGMAIAAAQVLIAFEHGYRLGGWKKV